MKEKEYDTLRQEIMHWQSRRFSVVTGSLVIVIAILGWAVNAPDKWSWTVVSSILFAMLTIAGYMTWLVGRLITRIGTYLEVFHENDSADIGWERRQRKSKRNFVSSKGAYATMFFGVGIISLAVSLTVCKAQPTTPSIILFSLFAASCLSMVIVLAFGKRPWDKYIKQWQEIKAQEVQLIDGKIPVGSAQQVIPPDRPQLASHQRSTVSSALPPASGGR
jgi:multisubunit Na+/H+ antiporter MnhG subunit